jgi:DNA-directed RNA polymerase specialized sigma24 family protein
MSAPKHDVACGFPDDELLLTILKRLVRMWRKQCPHLAEDLASEGLLQILQKGVSSWKGKAKLSTFLQSVGQNKGRDELRKELRRHRDATLVYGPVMRAEHRNGRKSSSYEDALIAYLERKDKEDVD